MAGEIKPKAFFTAQERAEIETAIRNAEQATSAEIKLIVLRYCWQDIKRKAADLFRKYKLDQTAERNAVLILLVTTNREFLIYGDEGINCRVGQGFWDDVRDLMLDHFRKNEMGAGVQAGIQRISGKLACYFPHRQDDIDEIDNGVVYEK